jgi:SOS-response transcriptional repressor LexA
MSRKTPTHEILEALEALGVPRKQIAMRLSVAPSAITDLFNGKRALKYDEAVHLQETFLAKAHGSRDLPVIGMAGAGNWIEAIADPEETVHVPERAGTSGKFVVEVVGQSMNQVLPDGSLAIIEPDETDVYVGKLYLLQNADGEGTIKRFRTDPLRFEPVSDDPTFEPIMIGAVDFQVVGRVTGAIQKF